MRWPGMDRSRLGRGELVLYPYIATAGEAPGHAAGGGGFRSGYARPTADPTGQLRVADRPMSLSRETTTLSDAERAAVRRLASDLPALWDAPTTQPTERQELVRLMLRRAVVTVQEGSENVSVECHWIGGH